MMTAKVNESRPYLFVTLFLGRGIALQVYSYYYVSLALQKIEAEAKMAERKECLWCREWFIAKRATACFCSNKCRVASFRMNGGGVVENGEGMDMHGNKYRLGFMYRPRWKND